MKKFRFFYLLVVVVVACSLFNSGVVAANSVPPEYLVECNAENKCTVVTKPRGPNADKTGKKEKSKGRR